MKQAAKASPITTCVIARLSLKLDAMFMQSTSCSKRAWTSGCAAGVGRKVGEKKPWPTCTENWQGMLAGRLRVEYSVPRISDLSLWGEA